VKFMVFSEPIIHTATEGITMRFLILITGIFIGCLIGSTANK
jgi:hypothetical protein